MKNLKKFEKSTVTSMYRVKGGIGGEKTSTTPGSTLEWKNDTDSNAPIEGNPYSSVIEPVEP